MSRQTATLRPPSTRDLLEAWRQSLGLTHERFAFRIGRTPGSWSRIRHDLQPLTADTMRTILRQADEPWRAALAQTWLHETLRVEPETARPSVGEPTAAAQAGSAPKKV